MPAVGLSRLVIIRACCWVERGLWCGPGSCPGCPACSRTNKHAMGCTAIHHPAAKRLHHIDPSPPARLLGICSLWRCMDMHSLVPPLLPGSCLQLQPANSPSRLCPCCASLRHTCMHACGVTGLAECVWSAARGRALWCTPKWCAAVVGPGRGWPSGAAARSSSAARSCAFVFVYQVLQRWRCAGSREPFLQRCQLNLGAWALACVCVC